MAEVDHDWSFTLMLVFLFSLVQGIKQVFIAGYVIVCNFLVAFNLDANIAILRIHRTIRIEVHICFRPELGIAIRPYISLLPHIAIHVCSSLGKGQYMKVSYTVGCGGFASCTGCFSRYRTQADAFTIVYFYRFVVGTCRYQCHGR